jgi:hypothetical protein
MNTEQPTNHDQTEVLTPSAIESLTRGEYDVSVSTAKRYPRSIQSFLHRAESLATATPEIAASCEYAKPVGGQRVKGPSARLAEIVAASYGNIRIQARIISETHSQVTAQGVAHDLETNVAQSTEVTVSLLKRDGSRVGPEQIATACASACAKARRNATFLVVPLAIVQPIIAKARAVAGGNAETLPQRRITLIEWLEKKGVKRAAIFEWLNVKSLNDIGLEEMADLVAAQNTAKEEGTDLIEVFGRKRDDSRFSDDEAPPVTVKQTVDAAKKEVERREAEPVTAGQCIELAKQLPPELTDAFLEKYQCNNIGDLEQHRLAELFSILSTAMSKKGKK